MKTNKKQIFFSAIIIVIIFSFIVLIRLFNDYNTNKPENKLLPVKQLVQIFYFDKGTFEEYEKLFADSTKVGTRNDFNSFRDNKVPADEFPKDYNSVDSVMKHMKIKDIDSNTAEVYWMEDIKSNDFSKSPSYWVVVKNDGTWLLK